MEQIKLELAAISGKLQGLQDVSQAYKAPVAELHEQVATVAAENAQQGQKLAAVETLLKQLTSALQSLTERVEAVEAGDGAAPRVRPVAAVPFFPVEDLAADIEQMPDPSTVTDPTAKAKLKLASPVDIVVKSAETLVMESAVRAVRALNEYRAGNGAKVPGGWEVALLAQSKDTSLPTAREVLTSFADAHGISDKERQTSGHWYKILVRFVREHGDELSDLIARVPAYKYEVAEGDHVKVATVKMKVSTVVRGVELAYASACALSRERADVRITVVQRLLEKLPAELANRVRGALRIPTGYVIPVTLTFVELKKAVEDQLTEMLSSVQTDGRVRLALVSTPKPATTAAPAKPAAAKPAARAQTPAHGDGSSGSGGAAGGAGVTASRTQAGGDAGARGGPAASGKAGDLCHNCRKPGHFLADCKEVCRYAAEKKDGCRAGAACRLAHTHAAAARVAKQ
jgi:hypothetical protein